METMAPAATTTLDEVLQTFYLQERKQDGSKYEPDLLKVMQAALEQYLCTEKYLYSLTSGQKIFNFMGCLGCQSETTTDKWLW